MKTLEFEQKYVLDHLRVDQIRAILTGTLKAPSHLIRQFYLTTKDGIERYRRTPSESVMEMKDNISYGTPFSVNLERWMKIPDGAFEGGWKDAKTSRLQKIRYQVDRLPAREGMSKKHTLMVDFFIRADVLQAGSFEPYAIIAEVEMAAESTTKVIDLDFHLPVSLHPFLLWEVDKRDPRSKPFASIRMCDTGKSVKQVQEAIQALR